MRKRKMKLNILSYLFLQITILISGFILPNLIIGTYGSEMNGLIVSITQFLGYITLLESGIGPVVKALLYKPIARKDKKEIVDILKATDKFFKSLCFIFCIYIIFLCFFYPMFVSKNLDTTYVISMILIISISTFAEYFFGIVYSIYLQAEQKTYISTFIQSITRIINLIVLSILILNKVDILVVKLVSCLIFVLRPLIQNIYVKKKYKISLKYANKNYVIENKWVGFSQHIASVVHSNADVIILTIFTTLSEVSVYYVYAFIVHGVKSILQAFSSGIESIFGNMLANKEYKNLFNKFSMYEYLYSNLVLVIYTCTIILIVPFVIIYTNNFQDANYVRPFFGIFITLSWFIWSLRVPYMSLIQGAGHFEQTKKGAWLEAILNVTLSIILVQKIGISGVAIGTLVAMIFRTVELIIYSNKNILHRSNFKCIKLYFVLFFLMAISCLPFFTIINIEVYTYFDWIKWAIISILYVSFIVLTTNLILFKKDLITSIKLFMKK